ncbi:MAG: hypothetical protein ACRD3E_14025 [Terriglobales bacterium]
MKPAFPVVAPHFEACAISDGRLVATSTLPLVSILLVSRGADQLIVPTPHPADRLLAEAGIAKLPPQRRSLVTMCDTDGEDLTRVLNYLEPLNRQVRKWPEDAFIGFAAQFLYEVVVATRHGAGVLSDYLSIARGFVPIIDPSEFSGEARFRLAEICRLICSYQPSIVQHGIYVVDAPRGTAATACDILDMAEFRDVVSASGRLGYLKHPKLALRAVERKFRNLLRNPSVKPLVNLAATAAETAGATGIAAAASGALDLFGSVSKASEFHPPFISIGPAELPLYRAALRENLPGAVPPAGTIMLFRRLLGGDATPSWLNVGEETKLEREAASGYSGRLQKYHDSLKALGYIAAG